MRTAAGPDMSPSKGKKKNEQGSCKPKAESKSTTSEKKFKAKRRKQLDEWQAEHKGTRRSAAQHLHKPGTTTKTAARKKSAKSTSSTSRRAA